MGESMPSPRDDCPMDTTGVYADSTTPEDDGETLMRATDTPLESSPAPTGVTIATDGKKRKYPSGAHFGDADEEDEPPKKKGKSKGKKVGTGKSKKGIDARYIPRTIEECTTLDRKLVELRDNGESWDDVRRMWTAETGEETGRSTLPNRYLRLKQNFTNLPAADQALLLKCHREVDEAFEKERWGLVSRAMSREGAQAYLPEVLQRQFKKLLQQGANLRMGRERMEGVVVEEGVALEPVEGRS